MSGTAQNAMVQHLLENGHISSFGCLKKLCVGRDRAVSVGWVGVLRKWRLSMVPIAQVMGLPADDLCLENAVVLERFSHRFPLVVDPAGQATRFLLNKYKVSRRVLIA